MTIPINPGDGAFSPWLSGIATSYEYYEFMSLKVSYSPSVSSFTSGAILLSPEFDPHNQRTTPPSKLSDFLNKQHAVTGNVWSEFDLTIPKQKLSKKLVRPEHSVSVNPEHLRQTDVGQVYIALYNVESSQSIPYGELFIEYDVLLTIPNQNSNSVKYHKLHAPNVEHARLGVTYGAVLGNEGNAAKVTEEPSFQGDGSLGITHQYIRDVGTRSVNTCDCTRITFNEPFSGQMVAAVNQHGGAMPSSARISEASDPTYTAITYDPDYEPASTARMEEVHYGNTGGTAADAIGLWNIVAAAGDVIDLLWSGAGDWTYNDVLLTMTEVGELLPLLL